MKRAGVVAYYVTFGQQYAREEHPRVDYAHPDGWLEIQVPVFDEDYLAAEELARGVALSRLGRAWSGIYSEAEHEKSKHLYPLGRLAKIDPAGVTQVFQSFRPAMLRRDER